MKNEKMKIAIKEIQDIKMTENEKKNILRNVLDFSVLPVKIVKSPYSFISIFQRNHFAFYGVLSCLIIFLSSGSMLLASQKSLPGNALYPLKVRVLEPLNYAFKLSPEDKAQYEISLVKERVAETKALASLGKLDSYRENQVNDLIVNHTTAFDNAIIKLKNDKPSGQTIEITDNFKKQLKNQIEERDQTLAFVTEEKNKKEQENGDIKNHTVAMFDKEEIIVSPENIGTKNKETPKNTKSAEPVNVPPPTYMGILGSTKPTTNTLPTTDNSNIKLQKYVNIALPLFTDWIEQLSKKRGDVLDYQINQINLVASKVNTTDGENSWFSSQDSNNAFIVSVNYSVQTIEEGKNNYWLAGNGRDGENGWVFNKSLFITIEKNDTGYFIKSIGTEL